MRKRDIYPSALAAVLLLLLAACQSDWRNGISPEASQPPAAVTFTSTVASSSVTTTRADGSLVNLNEYYLPFTTNRTYWRADDKGNKSKVEQTFYAGIFGCYTGPNKWADLVTLSEKDNPTADEKKKLNDYYSANLFYNVRATIGEAQNGANALEYDTLRYWPNEMADASNHEYVTYWAYYPYNPAESPGLYGISIVSTPDGVASGKGMGSVKFTMHPDAAQQNDFMISAPITDCNRDKYPLRLSSPNVYEPTPVQFRFYHMLAQVRLYAFIRGTDKLEYKVDNEGNPVYYEKGDNYIDAWGMEHTVTAEEAGKIQKIDEEHSVRWKRKDTQDVMGTRYRANISYKMEFANIRTSATFHPEYDAEGNAIIAYTPATTLGSATVNHYIMNPYWFRFDEKGNRYMLNDHYMYRWFEDTPAYTQQSSYEAGTPTMSGSLLTKDEDGIDWSTKASNVLGYQLDEENCDPNDYQTGKHYNYPPGNILMVVPQTLSDDDVPRIVITATGTRRVWNSDESKWEDGGTITARVTINMLKMGLKWESGFIYSYAFVDELSPGDDKVKGPESINVIVDHTQNTDQW